MKIFPFPQISQSPHLLYITQPPLEPPPPEIRGVLWDGMAAVSPKACLPSSEMNLCPMQQECRRWRGFWWNVFIEPRRHRAGRGCLPRLLHPPRAFMRYGSPCQLSRFRVTVRRGESRLTIWRSAGGLAVPCSPGSRDVLDEWRSGRFSPAVHSPTLERWEREYKRDMIQLYNCRKTLHQIFLLDPFQMIR